MILKSAIKGGASVLALIGLAAAPAALAADYHSNLLVQLTLTGVSAGTLGTDVTASFANGLFGSPVAEASGGAWASHDTYFYFTSSSYLENDQNVTGSAYGYGSHAYSEVLSNGLVRLGNATAGDVTFSFSWSIQGTAGAGGPGYADAFGSAEILDANYELAPIYHSMAAMTGLAGAGALNESGTFSLTLAGGASNEISVLVNSNGNAVMPVPEPEAYAMMLAGLGVLGAVARRRRQGS